MLNPCPSCGGRCEEGARFCAACGRPLDVGPGSDPHAEALTFDPASAGQAAANAGAAIGSRAASRRVAASAVSSSLAADREGHGRFEPGTILAGRYRVVALLGRGGMGEVYRADDLTLGQSVALKFLPPDVGNDLDRLTRFRSEVSVARQVSHPNVCRVYDIGEVDGVTFLSMEYIDGEDLASLLRRIGRLPADKGLEIARQVCAGLAAAHDRGVVHRDLKPANVMIDGRGQARIADFGLAAARSGAAAESIAGTPAYMAPEQFEGQPANVESDIYALGLVLYEIFTGKRAFVGSTVREFAALHRDHTPSSMTALVTELDPAIERAIHRCLEKDPSARPASALAVAASLPGGDPLAAAIARGETPAPEVVAAAGSVGSVKPAWALTGLALVVAALVALIVVSGYLDPARVVPMPDSPDVLRHRAQQLVQALGYRDVPMGVSSGFMTSRYLLDLKYRPWKARFDAMRSGEPAAIYFWYRQSTERLEPLGRANPRVAPDNPPETWPGMIGLRIDPSRGRLHRFVAARSDGPDTGQAQIAIDWQAVLRQAGFDPSRFTSAPSDTVPPVYGDTRAAWDGTTATSPGVRVHIEAAALGGRLVYWEVFDARSPATASRAAGSGAALIGWFQRAFMPLLLLVLIAAALLLALRNLRLARSDRRGAFRLATFLFAVTFASTIAGADHYARFGIVFDIVLGSIMLALLSGALAWIAYVALEPYVRRRLPHALISWSRLLSGRWNDPLVARDVLVGVAMGLMLDLWLTAAEFIARGNLGNYSPVWPLDGFRFALTAILNNATQSVLGGLGVFVVWFALVRIVRRQAIAAVLLVAILTAQGGAIASGDPALAAAGTFVGWMCVMLALRRFGLLMLVTSVFASSVAGGIPLTFDASNWFAPSAYLAIAVIVGLALYGAWTAASLRTVLPRILGDQ